MKYLFKYLVPLIKVTFFILIGIFCKKGVAQNCPTNINPFINNEVSICGGEISAGELNSEQNSMILQLENAYPYLSVNNATYTWYLDSNLEEEMISINDLIVTFEDDNYCDPESISVYLEVECNGTSLYAGELSFTIYPEFKASIFETSEGSCGIMPSISTSETCFTGAPYSSNGTVLSPGDWPIDINAGDEGEVTWYVYLSGSGCGPNLISVSYSCAECPVANDPTYIDTLTFCNGATFHKDYPSLVDLSITNGDQANLYWFDTYDSENVDYSNYTESIGDHFQVNHTGNGCEPEIALVAYGMLTCKSDPNVDATLAGTVYIQVYPDLHIDEDWVYIDECTVPTLIPSIECENYYDISLVSTSNQTSDSFTGGESIEPGDTVSITWTATYSDDIVFENGVDGCNVSNTYSEMNSCPYLYCPTIETPLSNATTQICDGDAPNYTLLEEGIEYNEGAFAGFQWYEDENLTIPITGAGALYHQAGDCEADVDTIYVGLLCSIEGNDPILAGSLEVTIFPEIDINHTIWLLENDGEEDCIVPSLSIDCGEEDTFNTPNNYSITYTNSLNGFMPGDTILPGTTGQILFNIDYAGTLVNDVCGDSGGVNMFVSYSCPEQPCPTIEPIDMGTTVSLCHGELPNLAQLESEVGLIGGTSGVTFKWYSNNNYISSNELPINGYTNYSGDKCEVYEQIIYLVAYCEDDLDNTPIEAGSVTLKIYPNISINLNNSIWDLANNNTCQVPTLTLNSNCGNSDFYNITITSTTSVEEGDILEGEESGTITWVASFSDGAIPCSGSFATYKYNYSCGCFKDGSANGSSVTYQNTDDLPLFTEVNGNINTLDDVTVKSNQKIAFQAQNSISIKPGFKTENNSAFKLKLGGCEVEQGDVKYATLQKKLDGSFYQPYKDILYVRYDEEYFSDGENLVFKIYDYKRNIYPTIQNITKSYGTNWLEIDLNSVFVSPYLGLTFGDGNYYILEVSNSKGEVGYLRFLY